MYLRIALVAAGLTAAMPASAQVLNVDEARRFVVGKTYSFTCFEGTRGAGRVYPDGSAAGVLRIGNQGPYRHMAVPPGTLRVKGANVCASLKGVAFEPCFEVTQTDHKSFRGAVLGFQFAQCTFTRNSGRPMMARATPMSIQSTVASSATSSVKE